MKKVIKSLSSILPSSHHFPSLPVVASLPLPLLFVLIWRGALILRNGRNNFNHQCVRPRGGSGSLPSPFCPPPAHTHGTTTLSLTSPRHHQERLSASSHITNPPNLTPPAQRCMQVRCLNLGVWHCNLKPLAGKHGQTSVVPVGCGGKGWSCAAAGWVEAEKQLGQRGEEVKRSRGGDALGGILLGAAGLHWGPAHCRGLCAEMFAWEHNGEV